MQSRYEQFKELGGKVCWKSKGKSYERSYEDSLNYLKRFVGDPAWDEDDAHQAILLTMLSDRCRSLPILVRQSLRHCSSLVRVREDQTFRRKFDEGFFNIEDYEWVDEKPTRERQIQIESDIRDRFSEPLARAARLLMEGSLLGEALESAGVTRYEWDRHKYDVALIMEQS